MATHTIPLDTTRLLAILADADMKMIFGCLAIASIGSLVTWIVGLSIYNIFFHPLANVPGPFWGKISDFHRAWQIYTTGSELVVETELHKRYGPLVRQGPGIVILNTASVSPRSGEIVPLMCRSDDFQ